MDKPRVSVVIPTYNHAKYVPSAVESVINQDYENMEILVVDDGSTDHTAKLLEPYMPKINYIYKQNGGTSSALNLGISKATGKYICWLSADDCFLQGKVTKQVQLMEANPAMGFCYTSFIVIDALGEKRSEVNSAYYPDQEEMVRKLLVGCFINGSSVMMRGSALKEIGGFDEGLPQAHDYDLWFRFLRKYRCGFLDEQLLAYRRHGENMSDQPDVDSDLIVRERAKRLFPEIFMEIAVENKKNKNEQVMYEYTTGLIQNHERKRHTRIGSDQSSTKPRPSSTFCVRFSNRGFTKEVVVVKGFYKKHHQKIKYISEVIPLEPQSYQDKKYYARFGELEFRFSTTSDSLGVFPWGRSKVGSVKKYELKKVKAKESKESINPRGIQPYSILPLYVYIPNPNTNTVSVVDSVTKQKVTVVFVGANPIGIGINPVTTRVYVVNHGSNDVTVIDGVTNRVLTSVVVGKAPEKVKVDPEQNKIFVYNGGSNNTSVISGKTYTVVETIDNELNRTLW